MQCKNCDCCHKVKKTRWNPAIKEFVTDYVHECWGVKEPFEIYDVNMKCSEYNNEYWSIRKIGIYYDDIMVVINNGEAREEKLMLAELPADKLMELRGVIDGLLLNINGIIVKDN